MTTKTSFSPKGYEKLINGLLERGYNVRDFSEADPAESHLVLRHDIDMSLEAAVEMEHRILGELRKRWKGNLILKGVMDPEDAKRIQNAGVDAIWVSNHGGRQLDGSPPALLALPRIRESVGPSLPIIFDSRESKRSELSKKCHDCE